MKKMWILIAVVVIALIGIFIIGNKGASPSTNNSAATGDFGAPRDVQVNTSTDGIPCESGEMLQYHIHAHLDILVNGQPVVIPAGIGIGRPWNVDPSGFVTGGSCFSYLHSHDGSGVIHMEAPAKRDFTLGQWFDMWGATLNDTTVGKHTADATNLLKVYVGGQAVASNFRDIKLTPHEEIAVVYGTTTQQSKNVPSSYNFPQGE